MAHVAYSQQAKCTEMHVRIFWELMQKSRNLIKSNLAISLLSLLLSLDLPLNKKNN